MSRVPADTVLLRLALAAVLAVPLSGCGEDETTPGQASTPPAASAPQQPATTSTSPATPTPTSPASPGEADKKDETASDKGASKAKSADAETTEAKPVTAEPASESSKSKKKASSKTAPPEAIADDMKRVHDALKAKGFDPGPPLDSGQRAGALQVSKDNTTILFFPSPLSAERSAAQYKKVFDGSPQSVTLDRTANRLYMLSLPKKPTDAQLKAYNEIRKIANGAV